MPKLVISGFSYWGILLEDSPLLNKSGLHGPFTPRLIARCTLSDGSIGWSEVPCNRGVLAVLEQLLSLIVGTKATVRDVQALLKTVVVKSSDLAKQLGLTDERGSATFDKGVTNHLRAAIQMAAYDAMARSQGIPLADLLGGSKGRQRSEVSFNAYLFWVGNVAGSGLHYQETPQHVWDNPLAKIRDQPVLDIPSLVNLAKVFHQHVMPGSTLTKLKAGVLDPSTEATAIIAMDTAFNQTMRFVPDPNGAWDVPTAVRITKYLKERLGDRLPYVEDLVNGQKAMAEVYAQTGVPQATNMCAANIKEHETAVSSKAIQITLGGDPHYMGGSDLAVELSFLCRDKWGIKFAQHSNTHGEISALHTLHMGAAAATHDFPFDTHYPWQMGRGILPQPLTFKEGGIMEISKAPGIGVDIDLDRLMILHERLLKANSSSRSLTDRDDGPPADMVYGGWARPDKRKFQWFFAGVQDSLNVCGTKDA